MDAFNALWDDPEQRRRPPDDNFQLFTMEEWFSMSSTHKILTGSLQCPLPHEIEPSGNGPKPQTQNCNIKDLIIQKEKRDAASQRKPPKDSVAGNVYIPGLVKFPEMDRISSLTFQEQADCLKLWLKYDGKSLEDLSQLEKTEYQLFQSLYSRVEEEQTMYLECAKGHWPDFKTRLTNLKSDAHNYFLQHWTTKVKNALSQYPHKYKRFRKFSLHKKVELKQYLHFMGNLLNIGKIPEARLPEFLAPFRIATSILKLRASDLLHVPVSQLSGTLHKVPVSADPNAERLAKLHSAKFVISTSGMRCLLDNHDEKKYPPDSGIGKSWVLPIVVKNQRTFSDGKPANKTIIFIDKPLPKPKLTGFQKVSWYQKHALFAAVVDRNSPRGIAFDIGGEDILIRKSIDTNVAKSENLPGTNVETNDEKSELKSSTLEKKASAKIEQLPSNNISSTSPSCNEDNDDDEDDDDDENALTIDLPDNEDVNIKQTTPSSEVTESDNSQEKDQTLKIKESSDLESANGTVSKSDLGIKDKISLCDGAIKSMVSDVKNPPVTPEVTTQDSDRQAEPDNVPNKWEKLTPPEPVKKVNGIALPVSTTNLTYNLWCLRSVNEENDQSQPDCEGDISLIIRSRIDGCELMGDGKDQRPISLATKPEYQLEYGPSIISLSDLTRQWAKLLIHPDTTLARIRVNVHSSDFVKLEKRTMLNVQEESEALYKTALPDTLSYLRQVLTELTELPVGQYLLSHSPEMGSDVELFSESDEADATDWHLAKDYGNRPELIDCEVPWPKIDTKVILPKHLHMQCMPCTFHSPKGPVLRSKPSKPPKQVPKASNNATKKKKNKKSKTKTPQVKGDN